MAPRPSVSVMCFSGFDGGMELDAIKLAHLLSGSCEVSLLCKQGSFIHDRLGQEQAFDVMPVRFHSRRFSPSMIRQVRRHIRQHGVSNVVFFGASELKSLYFAFLGLGLNVIVRHGTTKSHRKDSFIHRLIYSCVDQHVALSKHLLNNVRHIIPSADEHNSCIIHPSYESLKQETVRVPSESGRLYITHIGRMAEGKGQTEAVQACEKLEHAGIDFELHLVGGLKQDAYGERLQQLIDDSDIRDRVFLEGFRDDTGSFLARTDIFLFPSHGEGMPNAFIEAMYCGIPCIAFANTVFPEFLSMGFYVKLAKDRDIEDLADKLLDTVNNITMEKKRSSKNTALARECFSPERELAGWKSILI